MSHTTIHVHVYTECTTCLIPQYMYMYIQNVLHVSYHNTCTCIYRMHYMSHTTIHVHVYIYRMHYMSHTTIQVVRAKSVTIACLVSSALQTLCAGTALLSGIYNLRLCVRATYSYPQGYTINTMSYICHVCVQQRMEPSCSTDFDVRVHVYSRTELVSSVCRY